LTLYLLSDIINIEIKKEVMIMEIKLTYKEIQELRKALGQQIREIDCVEEADRYEVIGELYDKLVDIEIQLEQQ
jgi:predicted transport protein